MASSNRNLRYSLRNALFPNLDDTDLLQLYHLRSFPHQLVTSQVGTFNIQTAGLAFRSATSPDVVVFLYEPQNYSACFLPVVAPNSTLEWDTRAAVNVLHDLDISYWQQSTFLAHINGVVYTNYINWVSKYLKENSRFILHSICSSADELSCFVHSHTWDNFVADSMSALAKLAVQMRAILPPRATKIEIISFVEPVTVTPMTSNNNTLRKQIERGSEGFLQYKQLSTDVQDSGTHLRLSRRGISSVRRSLIVDGEQQFEQKAGHNEVQGELTDVVPSIIGGTDVIIDDQNDVNYDDAATIVNENVVDDGNNRTTSDTEILTGQQANSTVSVTSNATMSNSTGVANISRTNEWLIEKPPQDLFDFSADKFKQNSTDLDVIRFYLDLLTCMQGENFAFLSVHVSLTLRLYRVPTGILFQCV
jgi:hypothetical protein